MMGVMLFAIRLLSALEMPFRFGFRGGVMVLNLTPGVVTVVVVDITGAAGS